MRRAVLEYLACPNCAATLSLVSVRSEQDGHVMEATLACSAGTCRFSVTRGVPVLVPHDVDPLMTETAARFAEEWTRWTDLRDYYERQFLGWISPVTRADFFGRVIFEGGCGKGRHTNLVAKFGARAVVAIDLGESAFIAFENTRHLENAHIVLGDLTHPPVRPVFDLALSVGVVHHLPDPAAGTRSLASAVCEGGRMVIWVYGRENNEWIVRLVDPIRNAITSKIPYRALKALSALPSAMIWGAIKLLYRRGPGGAAPRHLPYAEYFSSMHDFPFDELQWIVFDQLVTPVAHYSSRAEVQGWFQSPIFRDLQLRWHNQMSWTATTTVVRANPAIAEAGVGSS
jgi:SAM-dependent methyltransferase